MPTKPMCLLIVVSWLAMTGLFVRREILPWIGEAGMSYREVLARRPVEQVSHWQVTYAGQPAGRINAGIKAGSWGRQLFISDVGLDLQPLGLGIVGPQRLHLVSEFRVNAIGRLESLSMNLELANSTVGVQVEGEVDGDDLHLHLTGLVDKQFKVTIDPSMLTLQSLAPLDELPDLSVGKSWTTRTVNPLSLVSGGLLGKGGLDFEVVRHRVVGEEAATWNGRSWRCFLVEHAASGNVSKSWVRVEDGKVLRHEAPIGQSRLVIELDDASRAALKEPSHGN